MPHSTSPSIAPSAAPEDTILADAPLYDLHDSDGNGCSNDPLGADAKQDMKVDVKLEDMFNDDEDDDDEFQSSASTVGKVEGSSPAPPL